MNQQDLNHPYFFDKEDTLIKKIIKEQGYSSCRDNFTIDYINWCLQNFTYGYVNLGTKASVGRAKREISDKYFLRGYIMFVHDSYHKTIEGRIFCVMKNYKNQNIGLDLLNSVKNFGCCNGATFWRIKSLPFPKLIDYYLQYGFTKSHEVFEKNGSLKVQEMYMNLQPIDIEEDEDEEELEDEESNDSI